MKRSPNEVRMASLSNVILAFRHWPRVFGLLWMAKPFYFSSILVLNVLGGLSPVALLLFQKRLIDHLVEGKAVGYEVVLQSFALYVIVFALTQVVMIGKTFFETSFESILSNYVNIRVLEKAVGLSMSDFENAAIQDQLKRAQNEAGQRPYQVLVRMTGILSGGITLVSAATVLIVWKWWAFLLVMGVPLISFLFFLRLGQLEFLTHWKRTPKMRESWYLSFLLTRDNSFKEVKLYQLGKHLVGKQRTLFSQFFQQDRMLIGKRTRLNYLFYAISFLTTGGLLLLIVQGSYRGEVTIGAVVALLQAIRLTEGTTQGLVQSTLSLCQNNLYLEQLFTFLDLPDRERPAEGQLFIQSIDSVEFRHVSFRYPGTEQYVLKNVSFHLQRGDLLAVVGPNGSGKSTLIKLLVRLYDDFEGEILINEIPVQRYDRDSLRRRIGIVFQDFVQYELTMRENIGFGDVETLEDDQQLLKASANTGIEAMVHQLPQGLDTQLGRMFEDGYQLSGGQWQRVAISRAFLREADLYAFDEPSSFLDPYSEAEVFEHFRQLSTERLAMYVSHRYATVRVTDRILVMNQGEVVEQGTHVELMSQNGFYAELYRLQMASYLEPTEAI